MGKYRQTNNSLQLGLFLPKSDWCPPHYYPDLSDAKHIAVDLECRDPNLKTKGPGGVRNDGEICGVSVATDTGYCGYFPVAHLDGGNLDRDITFHWLNDQLNNPNQINGCGPTKLKL